MKTSIVQPIFSNRYKKWNSETLLDIFGNLKSWSAVAICLKGNQCILESSSAEIASKSLLCKLRGIQRSAKLLGVEFLFNWNLVF